jgi:hypothetical protein
MRFRARTLMAFTAIAASSVTFPIAASASELGYTYAELRYLDIDRDEGPGADGGTAIGWYRLNENFFVIGQLAMTEADSGAETTNGAAGAGYILPINDQWDAVAIGTLRRTEVDTRLRDVSENGYGAQIGFRGMPIPKVEARAFVNYVDIIDDDTSFFVSGDYWFTPSFAAGVAAEFGDNADTFSIGVRYSFGR